MKRVHAYLGGISLVTLALAAACGGGGGGNGSSAPAINGTVNVQVTDGPSDEFNHVWVTVKSIAFHTDPNAVWSAGDASWQSFVLPSPVTVDLAALNNGTLNNMFAGLSLPVGTYHQIRFFFAGADDALAASALAVQDSNGATLQWNDQVEYVTSASTTPQEAPLEIAYPVQGIQLSGNFTVASGSTLSLAVDFDLEHDIVGFSRDGGTAFTLRPDLHYFDMSKAAAITGTVATANLCQGATASTCAFNLIVKAELLSSDGSRHYAARQTMVNPATGAFALYPLATQDANGNAIVSYDVVVRGRNMQTLLIQSVPVTAGTSPQGSGSTAPTVVSSTALPVSIQGEYTAQLATALAPLTSGWAIFQQTLPSSAQTPAPVPYEIRWRNTDPFTGKFLNAIPLAGVNSPLQVASYNAGALPSFVSTAPQEGVGGYTVADNEVAYYSLGTVSPGLLPAGAASAATFTPAVPSLNANVQLGTLTANLSFSGISLDNRCRFVISRFASIVDSQDCSSLLPTSSSSGTGTLSISGIPAGSGSTAVPGAYYYAYAVVWQAGNAKATRKVVPITGGIDFRSTSAQTVNATIIGG